MTSEGHEAPGGDRGVRSPDRAIDLVAAEAAAASMLSALGLDLSGESTRGTPGRLVRAYAELFRADAFTLTTFPNDEGYDDFVIVRRIPFRSVCEHHLLPFFGHAAVGYLPEGRIVGLSKLARAVEHFSTRPQVQERLTQQVCDLLQESLRPKGVGVVLEAEHTCMTLRGVRDPGAVTVTSALAGRVKADARTRSEFFALCRAGT